MPSHADDSGHLTGRGSGVSGLGSEQVAEVGVDPAGAALISQRGRLLIRSRRCRRYANLRLLVFELHDPLKHPVDLRRRVERGDVSRFP